MSLCRDLESLFCPIPSKRAKEELKRQSLADFLPVAFISGSFSCDGALQVVRAKQRCLNARGKKKLLYSNPAQKQLN